VPLLGLFLNASQLVFFPVAIASSLTDSLFWAVRTPPLTAHDSPGMIAGIPYTKGLEDDLRDLQGRPHAPTKSIRG
jgi:hypothetical protein